MTAGTHTAAVRAAQAGDHDAFAWLMERHRGKVFGICYRLTDNVHDAEDLAHESFVEAYVRLHTLREPAKFGAWLRTLTLNLCRTWYRRRRREPVESHPELPVVSVPPAADDSAYERVMHGLGELPDAHRLALVLHCIEGLSYQDTATFLGVPVGTVMSRMHRARQGLRRQLRSLQDAEEIPMIDATELVKEVDAEIALLLEMFEDDRTVMERLSVILGRSPERLLALVRKPQHESTLENLGALLPRLGAPAMGPLLDEAFGRGPDGSRNAARILQQFIAQCRSECRQIDGAHLRGMPGFGAYVLLDLLIARSPNPRQAACLLADLMSVAEDLPTVQLLCETTLCLGEPAYDLLLERFWSIHDVADVYRRVNGVSRALRSTGNRFLRDVTGVLTEGEEGRVALALAGLDAFGVGVFGHLQRGEVPSVRGARFVAETRDPAIVALVQLDTAAVAEAVDAAARFVSSPVPELRDTAIRVLERLNGLGQLGRIRECIRHPDVSTRVRAIQAAAGLGDRSSVLALVDRTRSPEANERRAAVEALGRLGAEEARRLFPELVADADVGVRRAAVIALGELGRNAAEPELRRLLSSPDKALRKAASSALYGLDRARPPERPSGPGRRPRYGGGEPVEAPDARRVHYVSAGAAIRALPELRPYDAREITERASQVCGDWATTRRKLIEHRLMRRPEGIYELTELGEAVWRVEHFIMDHWLRR